MDWLNYHHLLYFWTAAREGGVSRAAARLRLSQPAVSAQIRLLGRALGQRLFERRGRVLVLSDTGRHVYKYADEIFGIGRELLETLRGQPAGRPPHLTVGVVNAVPKLIACRLLRPALDGHLPMHLVCREAGPEVLLTELATHALDVVLSDAPAPPHVRVRVFSHPLGESATAFFAPIHVAARLRRGFPRSLAGVGMMLPTSNAALRRALDVWFEREGVRPRVLAEFEDSALLKAAAQSAGAVFPAPAAISSDVCRHYSVRDVGRAATVRERYYAISAERRVRHPGVLAITSAAREDVFAR